MVKPTTSVTCVAASFMLSVARIVWWLKLLTAAMTFYLNLTANLLSSGKARRLFLVPVEAPLTGTTSGLLVAAFNVFHVVFVDQRIKCWPGYTK